MKHTSKQEAQLVLNSVEHIRYVLARHRVWHMREQHKYALHPAIIKALLSYRPDRLHLLVLEWGHRSNSDPSRVAYTQNEAKGDLDLQTVTSVGKYLKRHFSYMPDHEIRDIVALYAGHSYEIVRTMPEMLDVLRDAPTSCMNNGNWSERDWSRHPYNVYDPAYGWGMAYSKMGGKITGRCLVNECSVTGHKIYVRSYNDNASFSHSDEGIEMWLRENGYEKANDWVGCTLKRIEHGSQLIAPYLDGDNKNVIDYGDRLVVCENDEGSHRCESQGGFAQEHHACTCDDCGDIADEDDMVWIGENDSYRVCDSCCDNGYVHAIGRRGYEYYVSADSATWVEDTDRYYHDDYMHDNGIVHCDDDGEYHHQDNCVYLDSRDEWVHQDSGCYVYCDHSGNHEHIDDCVELDDGGYALEEDAKQCEHSEKWYSINEDFIETPCGKTIHPDYIDEYIEEGEGQ
jgi:hypothetical protein